ncbi:MAG TPA: potassium transporter TrkG [Paracoccaceae bacterium]|nr:potassium transporter TrkG [Paracoccaceae bacterium]
MRRILDLPLIVILMGIGALAMLVPAIHAGALRDYTTARPFLYGSILFLFLTAMIGVATSNWRPSSVARSQLASLIGAYLVLPLMLAVPFDEAVADTSFRNAWFEMVSAFTTTGATLYDTPDRLAPSIHLWRALVGWLGGFFVLLTAAAILAPLNLGGVELTSGRAPGRGGAEGQQIARMADPSARLVHHALMLFPVYAGLTLSLWVMLLSAGDTSLIALCFAMATLSSSGITPGMSFAASPSGLPGEFLVFAFMLLAVTRRSMPGAVLVDRSRRLIDDHEVRLAALFLTVVPAILFLRHWVATIETDMAQNLPAAFLAWWGALFTTLSFLTTTGLESAHWAAARAWSGLNAPGLILLGLAMVGGGIATTTGGLKLLRVYALARQAERELDRMVFPSSLGGGGMDARRLRNEGAYVAWIFFMLFALTMGVAIAVLSALGVGFEQALVLGIAAVTTTGPLATLAAEVPIRYAELSYPVKAVLGAAMILGRLEVLAILALLAPGAWRR